MIRGRSPLKAGALALVWLLGAASFHPCEGQQGTMAVMVHPSVPVDNLSFAELRNIYLGNRQFWSQDLRITLLLHPPRSLERETVLRKIYEKSETQYLHYWIAKVFRSEAPAAPRAVLSNAMAGDLVRSIPGAIAVTNAARIPSGVKVLRIDGKRPNDPRYPLR